MERDAFRENYWIKSISLPEGAYPFSVEPAVISSEDRFFTSINLSHPLNASSPIEAIKSISLPEGWQTIQGGQFTYCYALESVYLPDSITVIGESAFFGCTNLKSVTIPANVTKIGEYALRFEMPVAVDARTESVVTYSRSLLRDGIRSAFMGVREAYYLGRYPQRILGYFVYVLLQYRRRFP